MFFFDEEIDYVFGSLMNSMVCKECGVSLDQYVTGVQRREYSLVCDDCYFDTTSDGIEEYPITSANLVIKRQKYAS